MKDAAQAMAQVVNRTGAHGTGNLKKDKARPWIDVGLRRPFRGDK
jgi:hypothetical protein